MTHINLDEVQAKRPILTPKRAIEAHSLAGLATNPSGTHAIVGIKRYNFEKKETEKKLILVEIPLASSAEQQTIPEESDHLILTTKASEGFWLSDSEIVYLSEKTLYLKSIDQAFKAHTHSHKEEKHGKLVGIFPTEIENIQLSPNTKDGHATLTFSAQVYADGDLTRVAEHEESDEVKEWDDVKVYDHLMIRHWDTWLFPGKKSQLFSVDLARHGGSNGAHWSLTDTFHKPHWSFASPFRNLLNKTKLESPVRPHGDATDYTVSQTHVAFTARDPDVSAAITTKHNIYIVPLDGSEPPKILNPREHGASSSPKFSPKGSHLVWLQMYDTRYEADRNRITIAHISTGKIVTILPDWQLSPGSINFTHDGKSLIGVVENQAQNRLFTVELHRGGESGDGEKITTIENHQITWQTEEGAVGKVLHTSHADEWIISASTLCGPAEVYLVSPKIQKRANILQSSVLPLTNFGQSKSSSLHNVEFGEKAKHFTYPGSNGREAYAWLVKPPGYDENAKGQYPLLVLVHGGPEGAWVNSWSARWNQLVFAAQGFVVVAFNPAGSTGYGQSYQEEILGQLGGIPHEDIQSGTKYVLDQIPTLDRSRVVAAGASYGGYMMNWIQGHNQGKIFKGLVCHDGIFSIQGMYYATEELYFPEHEAGGPLYDPNVREKFLQWSPERFANQWETPMLVIHGGKDYRLTESEGISAFTLLQRRGIESKFVYFPKENHWVLNPKNSLKWHQEVLAWLKKYSKTGTEGLRHTV